MTYLEIFMNIIIRKATIQDSYSLFAMNEEFNGVGCTTKDHINESLSNNPEIVMIAYADKEVAGFICGNIRQSMCYRTKQGIVAELFINKEYRRSGVGKQLITSIENEFIKNDISIIKLDTSVENISAQKFYESCGYSGKKECEFVYRKNIK